MDASAKLAFAVSQPHFEPVQQYIATQEEHHQVMNVQRELRALLRKYEVEWEEKYPWD